MRDGGKRRHVDAVNQTVLLLVVFLLPGMSAAWGYERTSEIHSRRSRDWYARLAGMSALCIALMAGPIYWLIARYGTEFTKGEALPWWLWGAALGYVTLPAAGAAAIQRSGFTTRLGNRRPAQTSWDGLFESTRGGLVRCLLKSGYWAGGFLVNTSSSRSYAAVDTTYAAVDIPDRDIYLAVAVYLDQDSGTPVLGANGEYAQVGGGVLIRRENIEALHFTVWEELDPPLVGATEQRGKER